MMNDNEQRRKGLLEALAGGTATGPRNTGIGGVPDVSQVEGPSLGASEPIAAPAPQRDFSRLTGYDEGKFNANKNDAKYQMGGVLSQFDPRQGLTPDVISALNGLGYGTFSGQGDKLSLAGLTDKGRQANLQGDYKDADFNVGFKSGNGKWGYADPAAEAQQGAAGGGLPNMGMGNPALGMAQNNLNGLLQGDPQQQIQEALARLTQGQQPNLAGLIAQLSGGR